MSDQHADDERDYVQELFQGMKSRGITGIVLIDTAGSSFSIVNGRSRQLQKMLVRIMQNSPELTQVVTNAMYDYALLKKQDYEN